MMSNREVLSMSELKNKTRTRQNSPSKVFSEETIIQARTDLMLKLFSEKMAMKERKEYGPKIIGKGAF